MENISLKTIKEREIQINWVNTNGYKGGWFADPFIIDLDDNVITILAEEFRYDLGRGLISKLIINRSNYSLLEVEPFLSQDTHLSFPYPIKYEGKLYICPESNERKEVALYQYGSEKGCEKIESILKGRMVDTQIVCIDNSWYAFTVKITGKGLEDTCNLQVYQSDSLFGPYSLLQTINNSKREERGAGQTIEFDGHIIRPAQICEGGYGKGVVFYELKKEEGLFTEIEIGRINVNPLKQNGLCFHTFSIYKDIAAVDGFDYKCRWLGKFAPFIYKTLAHFISK